jgi:hypothetical protein
MLHPEPDWTTVKRIHQAALDLPDAERDTFLEATCAGDEALLHEVRSLLAYQSQAESFLEAPAGEVFARELTEAIESPLVGRVLGHYQIESLLGAGGMGEVYLAHDPRLDRMVALKVLSPELASSDERLQRFTREARAASALNHPNVAVIHDVGESGGVRFIVMEHVEGGTLSATIAGQALPVSEVIDIAAQAAQRGHESCPAPSRGLRRGETGRSARAGIGRRLRRRTRGTWAGVASQ